MLTVLLATKNRAGILREVLDSYCQLLPPESGWKLVVVDNGSTDETRQTVASFKDRLPLEYLFEPAPGKNAALNTGLEKLEGDLAVFTDDDAFPNPNWLIELRKAADAHTDFSIFGGVVFPHWEIEPPAWIRWVDVGPVYTLTDPAWKEGPLKPYFVFGPNMAVRSSIFQSGARFDPDIGPRGSEYAMGSETEFVMRLCEAGHAAWHVENAVVRHFIRAGQLNKSWVMQRAIRYGRGQYLISPPETPIGTKRSLGVPESVSNGLLRQFVRMTAACILFRRETLFRARWRFNFLWGQALEARAVEQPAKTPARFL